MVIDSGEDENARGPIRLRTALAESDTSVTDRLVEQLGPDVLDSTLLLMGLDSEGGGARSARLDRARRHRLPSRVVPSPCSKNAAERALGQSGRRSQRTVGSGPTAQACIA